MATSRDARALSEIAISSVTSTYLWLAHLGHTSSGILLLDTSINMASEALTGVWRDYAQTNAFNGLILTLSSNWGNLLVSTLALLVTLGGACFWTIVAFSMHQYRARKGSNTALHLQTQVLLRNSTSPSRSLWDLMLLGHAWFGHTTDPLKQLGVLAIAPSVCWFAFTLAGIFVGKVVTPASKINNIRVQPQTCGFVGVSPDTTLSTSEAFLIKNANDSRIASAYVDNCYDARPGSIGCSTLPVQALPFTVGSIKCPFGDRCASNTLYLDSGYIDSNDHLGINAKLEDRLELRIVQTCSKLSARDFTLEVADPLSSNNTSSFLETYLGPTRSTNFTYLYPTRLRRIGVGYSVWTVFSVASDISASNWTPIPAINLTNADMTLHFISANSIQYLQPVFDPVFSANGTFNISAAGSVLYLPDNYLSVVACTDQYEYRDPSSGLSTGLQGYSQASLALASLNLTPPQTATSFRLKLAAWSAKNANIVIGQGNNALQATKRLSQSISQGLPSNQWEHEVTHWFKTALANLQARIAEFPTNAWSMGSTLEESGITVSPPSAYAQASTLLANQCFSQRVQSTGAYVNFCFPAVVIVVVLSTLIIIISLPLAWLVAHLPDRRSPLSSKRHKYRAYIADGHLNLLRMALSIHANDGWQDGDKTAPWRDEAHGNAHQYEMPMESDSDIRYPFPGSAMHSSEAATPELQSIIPKY